MRRVHTPKHESLHENSTPNGCKIRSPKNQKPSALPKSHLVIYTSQADHGFSVNPHSFGHPKKTQPSLRSVFTRRFTRTLVLLYFCTFVLLNCSIASWTTSRVAAPIVEHAGVQALAAKHVKHSAKIILDTFPWRLKAVHQRMPNQCISLRKKSR
jgi:hypothetical protein